MNTSAIPFHIWVENLTLERYKIILYGVTKEISAASFEATEIPPPRPGRIFIVTFSLWIRHCQERLDITCAGATRRYLQCQKIETSSQPTTS